MIHDDAGNNRYIADNISADIVKRFLEEKDLTPSVNGAVPGDAAGLSIGVRDSRALTRLGDPSAMHDRPATDPAAEALAVGAVLFKAHDAARHLEHLLELEAADPQVAELMGDAKRIRQSIGALLVDVAIESSAIEVPA